MVSGSYCYAEAYGLCRLQDGAGREGGLMRAIPALIALVAPAMDEPVILAMGHLVNCLRLQPLGLKACLMGLLDRQIIGGFCFLLRLGCLASQLLLPA